MDGIFKAEARSKTSHNNGGVAGNEDLIQVTLYKKNEIIVLPDFIKKDVQ